MSSARNVGSYFPVLPLPRPLVLEGALRPLCLYAWGDSETDLWIFMKFTIGEFSVEIAESVKFHLNSGRYRNVCGGTEQTSCVQVHVYVCMYFFVIKPTRCTNFTYLFCHDTLHVSESSSVHHQEFIHCTLSNGICHTSL